MPESYPKLPKNRDDAPESVRGIRRPFRNFTYADFVRAFDAAVGSKPLPSPGETALVDRARKFCRVLARFPGIRRIWVCNSLSMNAADEDSDIDLFIETVPGMIWTGRVVATVFFSVLGIRRHGNKVKGRFCLSFFAAEGADFGGLAIEDDAYLYEWARRLVAVDGGSRGEGLPETSPFENVLGRNRWSSALENNPQTGAIASLLSLDSCRSRTFSCDDPVPSCGLFSWTGEVSGRLPHPWGSTRPSALARFTEAVFRRLFLGKTLREYERLGKPWGVVVSDEFLKFHPEDRRLEIREEVRLRLTGTR